MGSSLPGQTQSMKADGCGGEIAHVNLKETLIKTKRLALSLVLIASLAMPSAALSQGTTASTHDWSNLKAVPAGDQLAINLKNGKTVEGKLGSVSETMLTLSGHNKPTD